MNKPSSAFRARASPKSLRSMGRRTLEVLRGVHLDVARGEFLALRGASGAGKSTLLHLIGGLDSPNAGEISFDGQNLAEFSESQLTHFRNRRVGFVFQLIICCPNSPRWKMSACPRASPGFPPRRPRNADANCSRASALENAPNTSRSNFPAANSSASPSPARLSTSRNCCWPTSRPATSIPAPAAKSSSCSKTFASKKHDAGHRHTRRECGALRRHG